MKQALVILVLSALFFQNVTAQCPPGAEVRPRAEVRDVRCNLGSDGAINIVVDQGTAPFTYQWSNGSNTPAINDLTAGTYSVTVTDALGCSATLSDIMVKQPGPFIYNVTIHNVTCFGGNDGSLDFFLAGGTAPYSYVWINAVTGDTIATTEDISNLTAGIYGVSIIDANGCTGGIFYLIAEAAQMNITGVITNVTCPGGSDGSIIVTVTGGTGTKTYLWSTGENSKNLLNKPAGSYTVTVTDVNGCTASRTFNITEPAPFNPTTTITDVSCNSFSDGAIDMTPSGGTAPYTFSWSTGATTEDIGNLAAGQYCVTLTDSRNCVSPPFCFTITEPAEISITADITNVICAGGSDGAIDITVSGGTQSYTYFWSNGTVTEDLSGLAPGIYTVIVTDANNCTATATYTVSAENVLIISVGITEPQCGESNGSATITVSGGTPPFTFQWSNGQSGATINGLGAGTYSVTVTDANGCTASQTIDISNASDISITGVVTNTICGSGNTGAIDVTVTGGIPPITFAWSNGANTEDLNGLAAGSYTITVTDSSGCQEVMTFVVTEESGLTLTFTTTPPNCGASDGSITVNVTGGTGPYTYLWSNGQSTQTISGLSAGVFSVTVTDANGCEETQTIALSDNSGPQITINQTDITCDNPTGTLEAVISSGTPPFTIVWSTGETTSTISGLPPGTYTVVVTDSAGCTASAIAELVPAPGITLTATPTEPSCNGATDGSIDVTATGGTPPFTFQWSTGSNAEDLSGLAAGTYSVTATDAGGCSATTTIVLDEPEEIIAAADTLTQPKCNGDSTGGINITVTGGTPPYNYDWWNGDTTEDLTNIATGQYCVVITDAHGCASDTFCFFLNEPTPVSITPAITQPTCNGEDNGSISVTVSGGTPPYTYDWSTGDTSSAISGLTAGDYSLTVSDANGCTAEGTFTVEEPDSLIATISDSSNVNCNGANDGTLTVTVSGGTQPYIYQWSNGANTPVVTGLPPGTYDVTVTDVNGCSDTSETVTITQPDSLLVTGNITQPNCTIPGSIDVIVSGGTPPYDYLWSTGDTTEDLSGISSDGTFTITVTDANGCTASATFEVNEPPVMDVLIEQTQELLCNGDSNAVLCARVDGVPGPYFYQWSTGDTTECISGVGAGTYSVTVANSSGCSAFENGFVVTEPNVITVSPIITGVTCFGDDDGSIIANVLGGTPPYTFQWSNGDSGNLADSLAAGPVTVTVTDANECSTTATFNIPEPEPFDFSNTQIIQNTCDTTRDGSIIVIVTGGTAPYSFVWSDSTTGNALDSLGEGDYSVTVTDANGCTGSATFTLDGPRCNEPPVAVDDTTRIYVCRNETAELPVLDNDYDPDGDEIFVSAILTQPSHGSAQLNSDQTITYTPDAEFIGTDTFSYRICETETDPSLCDDALVIITVLPCRPNITIPTGFSPNGDGTNDGFIIPGIEFYPDNVLLIFNRWGNKVREFNGYKNEWTGTNADEEPLPDGTYYFILELHDDANTTYTGYVVIHR